MAEELFIPKLGQTVEEVTLINWFVEDGAKVNQGEDILEVETDKAVFSIEATASGYLHIGPYNIGDTVPALTVIAMIGEKGETFDTRGLLVGQEAPTEEEVLLEAPAVSSAMKAVPLIVEGEARVFVSPRARKLARENNIDPTRVRPTGGSGIRVVEEDVKRALREGEAAKLVVSPLPGAEVLEQVPFRGIRKTIADRMATSVQTTARVTLMMEVDATKLVEMRTLLKDRVESKWGFAPGYGDLLAKIVALALKEFPYMNAHLILDSIEHLANVNIGIAVDTDRGLIVPVIRDVDKKDLHQFGSEFRKLVSQARDGSISPDAITGGTFTITNLGMYDVGAFTPVINLPEAAILGVGRIVKRPVVRDDRIVIRHMWTLSLVFDHRLVDGAPAARFLQYIKNMIEEPDQGLILV